MNEKLTLGSLFDGSGGFPLAGILSGINPIWSSELEPYCVRVTTKRLPNIKHYGDVSSLDGSKLEPVDIITFGSPCFPSGTLVLTSKGYTPIEEVKVDDLVLTHTGKWQKVLRTGAKNTTTVKLSSNSGELECTPNHPIYSGLGQWTEAKDMKGKSWAIPRGFCYQKPVEMKSTPFTKELFYFLGRWICKGWIQEDSMHPWKSPALVSVFDYKDKQEELEKIFKCLGFSYSIETQDNKVKLSTKNKELALWLATNFGKTFFDKKIPSWIYSLPGVFKKEMLQGIIDSSNDAFNIEDRYYRISFPSKKLAEGVRLIAEYFKWSTYVDSFTEYGNVIIDDKVETRRTVYCLSLCDETCYYPKHLDSLHTWYTVRSVTPTNRYTTVYNLEVENDNSYIADSIVVHNCQDLSIAGKREGIVNGQRSNLFFEAIRIIKEMREATNNEYPRYAIWENVPGAFSSRKGEDFKTVLESFIQIVCPEVSVPIPKENKWPYADIYMGENWSLAYRTLDAQYFGTPQRRRRIYLVADFRGTSAPKILFEQDCVSGNLKTSQDLRQDTTINTRESIDKAKSLRFFKNHINTCDYKELFDVMPPIIARYGTGGNNQPLVLSYDIRLTSEGTKNARANVYETDTARALDTNGNHPDANQGGVALVYALDRTSTNCSANFKRTMRVDEKTCPTVLATGPNTVALPSFCMTTGSFMQCSEEKAPTLAARDYKDPPIVNSPVMGSGKETVGTLSATHAHSQFTGNQETFTGEYHVIEPEYIVRRLTPKECAKLQGFPSWWCDDLGTENPSEEEIDFFTDVFEEHRKVITNKTKSKSRNQIIKWLKNPDSDSAQYKMWGNGIALGCAFFVLNSIAKGGNEWNLQLS